MIHFQARQLCQNCFVPFLKVVYSVRKEIALSVSKFLPYRVDIILEIACRSVKQTGPSCSKLTMSLVNVSLKF